MPEINALDRQAFVARFGLLFEGSPWIAAETWDSRPWSSPEALAARLAEQIGKEYVTSHHAALSRQRRLDAEQRLKAGSLRALVATASLELGIDIGDVDLVIQVGATRSIATGIPAGSSSRRSRTAPRAP